MSDAPGPVDYRDVDGGGGRSTGFISEEVARKADGEVRRLIDAAGERASRLLTGSRAQLDAVAEALLERETLTGEELGSLLSPARPRPAR